ncbi:hypothetical protein F965_00512 [Acinetobacter schindleri NIPH 900]|uniref:DdrB-like domain-containing protein n=1 Tax=Acinetobacter schindleri NIPH 900 TaxID=1217675 RepID=N8XYY3_9GAMM|nr:hypothetical protein [Acinetobacter schindleri]ENV14269.1 hypothetical protein F965_00512 [Acinetobacter schindleri NIPH 900]
MSQIKLDKDPLTTIKILRNAIDSKLGEVASGSYFKGRTGKAKTALGTKITFVYALIEQDKVIASHTATGAENSKYPQELQPRDRTRDSSIAWVQRTANNLDPESVGASGRADTGAPIVGDDMVVESGNGRTIAIKLAYESDKAEEYKEFLLDMADYFGFSTAQVNALKEPILIRVRTSEVDRQRFVVEANQDDKLGFTATERAKTDAKHLDDNLLQLFNPADSGDLLSARNQQFLMGFLDKLGELEAAQYRDSEGNFTQSFEKRVKQAIFAKAYSDDRLIEKMADMTNIEDQNIVNALVASAPSFIKAQSANRAQVADLSTKITDGIELTLDQELLSAVVEAMNVLGNAKRNNQDLNEYLKQQGLFEEIPEGVAEIALYMAKNKRSAKSISNFLNEMAEYIEQTGISHQNFGLFGEPEPIRMKDVVDYAIQQLEIDQQGLFDDIGIDFSPQGFDKCLHAPEYS